MFVKNGVRNSALNDETTRVSQSTEDAMGGAMVDSAMQRPRSRHTLSLPTRQRGEVILPWLDEDGSRSYIMDGFFSGPRSGGTRRARSVSGPVFGEMISVINPDAIRRFSACTPRANSDLQGFDNSMYMMCSPSSQPRQSCMRHSEKFRGALPPIPTTSEDNWKWLWCVLQLYLNYILLTDSNVCRNIYSTVLCYNHEMISALINSDHKLFIKLVCVCSVMWYAVLFDSLFVVCMETGHLLQISA